MRAFERELIDSPDKAPVIEQTGGLRKLRFAPPGSGRGSSGAYRVCYAYFSAYGTVALFVIFGKNERSDLSPAEARATAKALRAFEAELRRHSISKKSRRETMKSSRGKSDPRAGESTVSKRSRHGISPGRKILGAIEEATEILRAEGLESNKLTIRTYEMPPVPRVCRSGDVKRVRELLGASQAVFAGFLGVNVNTVRSWEQGKRLPQPIACRFLSEIESDPVYWRQRIGQGAVQIEPGNRPEGGGRRDQAGRR